MLFMSVFIVTAETVQRHYIPRTLPGSPNPPTRTLPTCSARRRQGRSCAAWGRSYFAPLSLPKPAAAPRRRIPISTPLTVFPPTTHTPLLFLKAACSVKRHARGGAQYAPPSGEGSAGATARAWLVVRPCSRPCIDESFSSAAPRICTKPNLGERAARRIRKPAIAAE